MANIAETCARTKRGDLRLGVPGNVLAPIAAVLDCLALVAASCLAELIDAGPRVVGGAGLTRGLIAGLATMTLNVGCGCYRYQALAFPSKLKSSTLLIAFASVLADVALQFLTDDLKRPSREAWIVFAVFALALAPLTRLAYAELIRAAADADALRGRRVVVIGTFNELASLTREDFLHFGITEAARFPLYLGATAEGLGAGDLSQVERALVAARTLRAAEFALFLSWNDEVALASVSAKLRTSPMPVRLYADRRTRDILKRERERRLHPAISVEIQRRPLGLGERLIKRAFDTVVAAAGMVCLSPLFALVAILIKCDSPGPVLFKQKRRGFDNLEFRIWKFRTMSVLEDGPNIVQAHRNDKRVTQVGRILRRTSIDELPQLVNVLIGDMAIVGPRPHALAHDEVYGALINDYAIRHQVKPGLTGAAQIAGLRGETETVLQMEARVRADLWYINHWSLWLDIQIILRTFGAVMMHEAY